MKVPHVAAPISSLSSVPFSDLMLRFWSFILILSPTAVAAEEIESRPEEIDYFERRVRPLLVEYCYSCHSAEAETIHGGLRLDSRSLLMRGGDSGPAIDYKDPDNSLLLKVVRHDGEIQMPPEGSLSSRQIKDLTHWIRRGAGMPNDTKTTSDPAKQIDFESGRQFWSFQSTQEQPLPAVKNTSWPRSRLDYFVLAAMERERLSPSVRADRATLLRRLSFDLVGLPPTPEEVQDFQNDSSATAWESRVDQYLQSPHYGERWARLWLDLARYTDKTATWLYSSNQAHLYRDWVVDAFNNDLPYDEFVHRQLATDLMPQTGPEDLPALGFISLSPTYWKELKLPCEVIRTIVADEWEERVDATTRTFLGLTVACARCHDHKFDPISSDDYYALAGVFASCRQIERPIIEEAQYEPVRQAKEQVSKLQNEINSLRKQKPIPQKKIGALTSQINDLKSTPLYDTPLASALSEESLHIVRAGPTPQDGTKLEYRAGAQDLPRFIRGNANRPGPIVPRRFLTVLSSAAPAAFVHGSGRLELAEAITTDAASLTARVIVNRIWLAHFGRGVVSTPSNFGQQGSRPSHPDLLDDLSARFIADGWSIKRLHREILLSATWQQSSACDSHRASIDPDNRWLSRMNRRRLEFESWRDAMLSTSGVLDRSIGGPSSSVDQPDNRRRTLYSTVHRRDMSTTLTVHDFPDPTQHSPARSFTTTPLQGLYALNGPLLNEQAKRLVNRLQHEETSDEARIHRACQLLYSRTATTEDLQTAMEFLGKRTGEDRTQRWKQYAQVLLASNELLYVD